MSKRPSLPRQEVRQLLDTIPVKVILDVGANDGSDTVEFLRHCWDLSSLQIHAFEPDPRAACRFIRNVPRDGRVRLHRVAVSDKGGTAEFHVARGAHPSFPWYGDWDKASSLRPPGPNFRDQYPWLDLSETVAVPTVTLDEWASANGVEEVAFMWVDVEGHTDSLIRGATETLKGTHYFYTEYTDTPRLQDELVLEEVVALLPDFQVVEVFAHDVLFKNRRL